MKSITKLVSVMAGILFLAATSNTRAGDPAQANPKPDKLTTCPVSGDKLGEMGKPYVFEYKGQEVKLCCKSCRKDFDKNPEKYLKKIRAADQANPAKDKAAK